MTMTYEGSFGIMVSSQLRDERNPEFAFNNIQKYVSITRLMFLKETDILY